MEECGGTVAVSAVPLFYLAFSPRVSENTVITIPINSKSETLP
jgi:hypothetical protein